MEQTVGDASPFIDRLLPDTRALGPREGENGTYQPIIAEPTYLSVHPPGEYETLTVELLFQNTAQPLVELGLVVNDDPIQYTLEPVQNLLVDGSSWERFDENGITLLQREQIYRSVADFLSDPPERQTIATYHYALEEPYRISAYSPAGQTTAVNVSLRGYHEYVTYVKNEPLMLQATFMDMNREYGEDVVELLVVNEAGEIVGSSQTEDDGEMEATSRGSSLRNAAIVLSDLPEGVYKVILKADRDIFFRMLSTRQRYVTFVGPIFLGDETGYRETPSAVSYVTDGKHLTFETYHADAAQEVAIGSGTLLLPEAQVRYAYDVTESGLVDVSASAGDFLFTGDGKVAFSAAQFFNPDPVKLNWNTDLDDLGINFIVAEYAPPVEEGDWLKATATFNLSDVSASESAAPASGGKQSLKLLLAAPGIATLQNEVQVHGYRLIFERPPLSREDFIEKVKVWIGDLF